MNNGRLALFAFLTMGLVNCVTGRSELRAPAAANDDFAMPIAIAEDEAVITLVGTNDIHGNFDVTHSDQSGEGEDPGGNGNSMALGGFQWFAGYVAAIR